MLYSRTSREIVRKIVNLFSYTDLSKLDKSQKNQLVELHKKSLPDTPFSMLDVIMCTKIYDFVASSGGFFNSVAVFNGQPIGLCVGKTSHSTKKVVFSKKIYLSYIKEVIVRRKIFFYRDFIQLMILIIIKNQKSKQFWIELIFVDESFKNLKIGSSLLSQYINIVPHTREIWVDTKKTNTGAACFYSKHNFKEIEIPLLDSYLFVRKGSYESFAN
jgi:ribosomal protein S18 acetylase RimI-like enzyme